MILPDASPEDILNYSLRMEALRAQERGDGISVWHGRDMFTGEDVELLIDLESHKGYMALGDRAIFPGRLTEDGPYVNLTLADSSRGHIVFDLDSEDLKMNPHRVGVEYVHGGDPKLRLYDRLTSDTILEVEGDQLHELVDTKVLDPKDYPKTGLAYAESLGLV